VAKQQRVDVCTDIRQLASENETFMSRVITGDMAPCDVFLFLKIKLELKGRRFDTIEENQAESQRVLDTLDRKEFHKVFQKWRRRWHRCVNAGGNYFEGDGGR
jgi:hypothetical protein